LLLQWIQTYHSLYLDLAKKESQFLTEKVIENDIRCNAYLYYRRKKNEEEWFKYQKKRKEEELKSRHHFKNEGKVQVIDVDLRNK
jgi:hypothetical protein